MADFRDAMAEKPRGMGEICPSDPTLWNARLAIELTAADFASRLVRCTPAARDKVAERYASISRERMTVIPNGDDEGAFRAAGNPLGCQSRTPARCCCTAEASIRRRIRTQQHSVMARRALADDGVLSARDFESRLRGPWNERYTRDLSTRHGVADLVTIASPVSCREALSEMLSVNGLLLVQGVTPNPAIPAKTSFCRKRLTWKLVGQLD